MISWTGPPLFQVPGCGVHWTRWLDSGGLDVFCVDIPRKLLWNLVIGNKSKINLVKKTVQKGLVRIYCQK